MNRGRSLRTAIRFSVVALVVFTVLAVGMATVSFARVLDARDELNNRVNPAQRQVETYLSAVVDQETSLRAFLVAEDATFLDTYRDGVATAEEAADGLRRLLPEADGDTFAAVEEAVAGWEDGFVTPVLEGSDLGRRQLLIDGKEAFDDVRTEVDQLRSALVLEDEAARERLDQATVQLVAILVVVAGSLIGVGIAGWVAYRRRVEGPLLALAADAELVASGELQHPITEVGPEELREVARAMEAMRARIIEEVRQLEAAREILEFQADDLARSNAELEQFAYVASHDLQEPLRKVASFCQLLEQRYGDQFDERAHQYIHYASDGAKRMQVLITDLLAFSRVGRLGADLVSIDLDVALDRALDNLSTVVEESGAEIARDDLPEVQGDPTLLAALFRTSSATRSSSEATAFDRSVDHCSAARRSGRDTGAGQRDRHRRGARGAGVHHLPAAPWARRLRGNRDRSGAVPQDRRAPRRPDHRRHNGHRWCAGPLYTAHGRSPGPRP